MRPEFEMQIETHPMDIREKLLLPSERLVRRFPSIAPIAALEAALVTTKSAILCDNPSIQELMDLIENGEKPHSHLFIAHNIIDNLDRLRLTIHAYFDQIETHMKQIKCSVSNNSLHKYNQPIEKQHQRRNRIGHANVI